MHQDLQYLTSFGVSNLIEVISSGTIHDGLIWCIDPFGSCNMPVPSSWCLVNVSNLLHRLHTLHPSHRNQPAQQTRATCATRVSSRRLASMPCCCVWSIATTAGMTSMQCPSSTWRGSTSSAVARPWKMWRCLDGTRWNGMGRAKQEGSLERRIVIVCDSNTPTLKQQKHASARHVDGVDGVTARVGERSRGAQITLLRVIPTMTFQSDKLSGMD